MKFILIFFICSSVTLGAFEVEQNKIEFKAGMGDTAAPFEYTFKNTSDKTETIESVSGGCSCIDVSSTPRVVAPGGTGKISGLLQFHTSVGKQRKIVTVEVTTPPVEVGTEPIRREFRLILEGDIPSPIKVSKSALIWIDGESVIEKPFTIAIKPDWKLKSLEVLQDPKEDRKNLFSVTQLSGNLTSGFSYSVKPKSTILADVSPNFRDYFCRLIIKYVVLEDSVEHVRNERIDLLLSKKPGVKYDQAPGEKEPEK